MTVTYTYNPACGCKWCRNNGEQPADDGSAGHSWAYEEPHNPPVSVRARFTGTSTQPTTAEPVA